MTHDELRKIAANDDDPQSSDGRRGTPGEALFGHWLGASQEAALSESTKPNEYRD